MPIPAKTLPPPQNAAAAKQIVRGPAISNHLPATAAERPTNTMATTNICTTWPSVQSSALEPATPTALIRAGLYMLQAYTEPMHKWMQMDAGTARQRLYLGLAIMLCLEKNSFISETLLKYRIQEQMRRRPAVEQECEQAAVPEACVGRQRALTANWQMNLNCDLQSN